MNVGSGYYCITAILFKCSHELSYIKPIKYICLSLRLSMTSQIGIFCKCLSFILFWLISRFQKDANMQFTSEKNASRALSKSWSELINWTLFVVTVQMFYCANHKPGKNSFQDIITSFTRALLCLHNVKLSPFSGICCGMLTDLGLRALTIAIPSSVDVLLLFGSTEQ